MATSAEQLCHDLPLEFTQYMREVRTTRNRTQPDYERLRSIFRGLAVKKGVQVRRRV